MSAARRLALAFVLVGALALGLGLLAAKVVKSPAQVAAESDPPAPNVLTAPVTSGTVEQTLVARGHVRLGRTVSVRPAPPHGVDAVVTRILVRKGRSVTAGRAVMEISYRPLILLKGRVPLIRDLSEGSSGADVSQLQAGLRDAGHPVTDREGFFGASTARALTGLYTEAGYDPPTAEPDERDASDASSDHDDEPDGDRRSSEPVLVASRSEIAFVPRLPGRVTRLGARVGELLDDAAVHITTSRPTVVAAVDPSAAERLRPDMAVTVVSPDGTVTPGTISSIGAPVQDPQTQAFAAPLTVAPGRSLSASEVDAEVQVHVDLAGQAEEGLIVPVSALYARADASTSVVVWTDGERTRVPVEVRETGDGLARVEPTRKGGLRPGDVVVVGVS